MLDGSWNGYGVSSIAAKYDYGFSKIPNQFVKGPAFSVTVGNYYELEVLIGEQPGGEFFAALLIEKMARATKRKATAIRSCRFSESQRAGCRLALRRKVATLRA